jgi:hypothetical protein
MDCFKYIFASPSLPYRKTARTVAPVAAPHVPRAGSTNRSRDGWQVAPIDRGFGSEKMM